MERLVKILNEMYPDVDFYTAENLIDDGIIDSYDIVALVMEINEIFDKDIGVLEITPENFNSAKAIWELIETM